jgi:membrane AbrB-like protein
MEPGALAALRRADLLAVSITLVIAAIGGAGAFLLHLPAPWLSGPTAAVAIAAACGLRVGVPDIMRDIAFAVIGISIGSSVTGETFSRALEWPLSLAALAASVVVGVALGMVYLQRVHGFDSPTAKLSSVPGALGLVLALSAGGYGDPRTVALLHATRLILLTAVLPLFLQAVATLPEGVSQDLVIRSPWLLAGLIAGGIGLGALLARSRLPAPHLMGGLLVSLALHVSDVARGGLPGWIILPGLLLTGAVVGSRFSGISLAELRRALSAGVAVVAIAASVSAAFALFVSWWLVMPFVQVWIAFAPGGIEAMAALAIAFDVDAAYVATHHVLRFLALSLLLPLWIGGTERLGRGAKL